MDAHKLDLEFQLLKLTLSLYNNPLIPRKIVQFFIDSLINFIFEIFFPIVIHQLRIGHDNEDVIKDIERIFKASKEIFAKFHSESHRLQTYKEKESKNLKSS